MGRLTVQGVDKTRPSSDDSVRESLVRIRYTNSAKIRAKLLTPFMEVQNSKKNYVKRLSSNFMLKAVSICVRGCLGITETIAQDMHALIHHSCILFEA